MSEDPKNPGGEPNQDPVGHDAGHSDADQKAGSVSYETHRKLLAEKKKRDQELALVQQKLAEKEAAEQALKEQQLKDDEKWQEYAQEQKKKAEETQARLKAYEDKEVYQRKVGFIRQQIPGFDLSKYHTLIDDSAISYDASSGDVDESSVQKEVERLKSTYPELVSPKPQAGFPGDAPKPNNGATLSTAEYARLSRDEKKIRMSELKNVPDWMLGK